MTRTHLLTGAGSGIGELLAGALLERGITPDLVLGTSVGALNGAFVAQDPTPDVVDRLTGLWETVAASSREVYGDRPLRAVRRAVATGTHVWSAKPLATRLREELGEVTFADLAVPLQVCAAHIERAAEHWFDTGDVVDAVVASAAVPGLLPPKEIDGEHYLDGGIVNSVPVARAHQLGATRVFVLQVGRMERPLSAPRRPWDVARVSFEIARRHRFNREMAELPESVEAHVLPTGGTSERDDSVWATRDFSDVPDRIRASREASAAYLDTHLT